MTDEIQKKPRRIPWGSIGILFSTFSVIVLLFLFFATNAYYLRNFRDQNHIQENLLVAQKTMGDVEHQIGQLTDIINSQNQNINTLRQAQMGYQRDEWRIIEADFLVRLANDKLQLEGNISQGIILLQEADKQVRDLQDQRLLPLRKALASDIANLQSIPAVDVAGLYLRLSARNEQIDKLSLPNKPADNTITPLNTDKKLSWWKRGLEESWHALRQVVVVRYNKNSATELVMPEQQAYLYQNLHSVINQAIWGLLHMQPVVYQTSLKQASSWIKQYFLPDAPVTKSVLSNLTELQQINIHVAAPKISDSLQAFQEYFATQGGQTKNPTPATSQ